MRTRQLAPILVVGIVLGALAATAPAVAARTRPTQPARLRVFVAGQSEAATLATGGSIAADPHGLLARPDLVVDDRTIFGCSISTFPVFVLPDGQTAANQCGGTGAWQRQWATDVPATRPDVVFVMAAARDVYDVAEPDGTILHPGDAAWTAHSTADLHEMFQILGSTGAPIVAVKPSCFGRNTLPDGEVVPNDPRLEPARVDAVAAAWRSAARASGVRLLDFDAVICDGGVVDPVMRADGVHFTAAAADRLAPRIATALRHAVRAASAQRGSAQRPPSDPARRD